MSTEMDTLIVNILKYLYNNAKTKGDSEFSNGSEISGDIGLSASEVNDAVTILEDYGFVEIYRALGTAPYDFAFLRIIPRGKYEVQKIETQESAFPTLISGEATTVLKDDSSSHVLAKPLTPVGSPYGFEAIDWEYVANEKANQNRLKVVLGCQYKSVYYDTQELRTNVEGMFQSTLNKYNSSPNAIKKSLNFVPLAAGYGEHAFNEIARDIISADIAVFETSDLNPNVMIEMGVALTHGIIVLPIKVEGRPEPPSDISGQTWADYRDNASAFPDTYHETKLFRMVDRASRKKRM